MGVKLHETIRADGSHYGWSFYCPGCESLHQCDDRWGFNGERERPTFEGSVLVYGEESIGRPRCHSFVKDGRIQYLGDSTHAMAGQTVELPDWDAARDPYG